MADSIFSLPFTQIPGGSPSGGPPVPDEANAAGQVIVGMGLSGLMLAGFVFLIAFLIIGTLTAGWMAKRPKRPLNESQA